MSNADRKYAMELKADYEGILDFTVAAGTTDYADFTIPYVKWISGIQLILNNANFRDQVWFQIVADITGVGTDIVLEQFGEHWYVDPDNRAQILLIPDNVQSKLDPMADGIDANTLRLRFKYKSTGATDVDVLVNVVFDKE